MTRSEEMGSSAERCTGSTARRLTRGIPRMKRVPDVITIYRADRGGRRDEARWPRSYARPWARAGALLRPRRRHHAPHRGRRGIGPATRRAVDFERGSAAARQKAWSPRQLRIGEGIAGPWRRRCHVGVNYSGNAAGDARVVDELRGAGAEARASGDVAREADVEAMSRAAGRLGPPDILVTTPGSARAPLTERRSSSGTPSSAQLNGMFCARGRRPGP